MQTNSYNARVYNELLRTLSGFLFNREENPFSFYNKAKGIFLSILNLLITIFSSIKETLVENGKGAYNTILRSYRLGDTVTPKTLLTGLLFLVLFTLPFVFRLDGLSLSLSPKAELNYIPITLETISNGYTLYCTYYLANIIIILLPAYILALLFTYSRTISFKANLKRAFKVISKEYRNSLIFAPLRGLIAIVTLVFTPMIATVMYVLIVLIELAISTYLVISFSISYFRDEKMQRKYLIEKLDTSYVHHILYPIYLRKMGLELINTITHFRDSIEKHQVDPEIASLLTPILRERCIITKAKLTVLCSRISNLTTNLDEYLSSEDFTFTFKFYNKVRNGYPILITEDYIDDLLLGVKKLRSKSDDTSKLVTDSSQALKDSLTYYKKCMLEFDLFNDSSDTELELPDDKTKFYFLDDLSALIISDKITKDSQISKLIDLFRLETHNNCYTFGGTLGTSENNPLIKNTATFQDMFTFLANKDA